MKFKSIIFSVTAGILLSLTIMSCSTDVITAIPQIFDNNVSAKDRLDSANAQATRKYGASAKLVLILGQNVLYEGTNKGKTDISIVSAIADPNSLGAWIYLFKKPGTDTLAVYTPNPIPGAKDCIELTKFFSTSTIIGLIQDTSARNIVSGAISLLNNSNFTITTSTAGLADSHIAFDWANTSNPIIKFNSGFIPGSSTLNGNYFFNVTGATKTVNMFLIPALGTLNLPAFISNLTGFPADLWVVNYKKSVSGGVTENLIMGTVVQSAQQMTLPVPFSITSKCINLSKFVNK